MGQSRRTQLTLIYLTDGSKCKTRRSLHFQFRLSNWRQQPVHIPCWITQRSSFSVLLSSIPWRHYKATLLSYKNLSVHYNFSRWASEIISNIQQYTTMTDVESSTQQPSGRPPHNPYSAQAPGALPPDHIVHKLKRIFYMGLSAYCLHYFKFYKALVKSPKVQHEWFQVGLACTVGESWKFIGMADWTLRGRVRSNTDIRVLVHSCHE